MMNSDRRWRSGGYVRIGSVSVRVRQDDRVEEGDCCCGVPWLSRLPLPLEATAKNRAAASLKPSTRRGAFTPSALDRLSRTLCPSGARAPASNSPKRRQDKSDRLRELTEKLKILEPSSQQPVKTAEEDIFDLKLDLVKPESRSIVGAYIQRTIPFRSASFSQVDYSPSDGKYNIRAARNIAVANKVGASLSLPRKKVGSNVSLDSAVGGSQEWTTKPSLPPVESKQNPNRSSCTHSPGRRGSDPDENLDNSIDGSLNPPSDRVLKGASASSDLVDPLCSDLGRTIYHLIPADPPSEHGDSEEFLNDILEEETNAEGVVVERRKEPVEKIETTPCCPEEPQSPDEVTKPFWPKLDRKNRPKLVTQSSEESERRLPVSRTDSLSEGESENGRGSTPSRHSPSLFSPSDQSDSEGKALRSPHPPRRYSKRPLRGPYGQMLEAEMKKPETRKFTIRHEELNFLEDSPRMHGTTRARAVDDSQLKRGYATDESKCGPKRKISSTLPVDGKLEVHHQRTTSSPSQLEGCSKEKNPQPSHQLLAQLLKGSSERSLTESNPVHLLINSPSHWKDTRTHVVVELYDTERSYVDSLKILVTKYLQPLKNPETASIEVSVVDEIFYKIPEILSHHEVFLEELRKRLETWDLNQQVADLFLETFTKQSVIDTYTDFINNWEHAKEAIKSMRHTKPAFGRFLEAMAREHKGKLALDSLLIMPVQRIPRYELLIGNLLKHTDPTHNDASVLLEAQKAIHELAVTINLGQHKTTNPRSSNSQELTQLEGIIEGMAGLASPDRTFLCHDQVSITTSQGKKDRALFLFNDLLVITSIKRRSGTIKKITQNVPVSVVNTLEGNKFKLLMKIPLADLEIVKAKDDNVRKMLKEMEQLNSDVSTLSQMEELVTTLHCPHSQLEENIRDMLCALKKQLVEKHTADSQLSYLELVIKTTSGLENIALIFGKPEKRTSWEESFNDAKQRLALSGDRRLMPELVSAVPIRKTRAGLQFTCAAPTQGSGPRDVWVCNSDGYVGQVCVLSLHPEPTVTSCNGVCNARILCIAPVPGHSTETTFINSNSGISISVEDTDKSSSGSHPDRLPLYSSSSSSEDEREEETELMEDSGTSTMWLGTEDGCIHVYNCTDNIRTKKNKIKIQHNAPVHTIIYLDNRVFVSLANGDITVYTREPGGNWFFNDSIVITVGSAATPVTKMVPIAGRLWCSCHTTVKILNTTSLLIEHTFLVCGESNRSVTSIAVSGLSVWISLHNSATIRLFHATTYEWLGEVNIAPAVTKMLASSDDIIRQHKAACLRVTSLLGCKELLWIGTSAGVILTMPLPQVTPTTTKLATIPTVTGVPHGHTGHVRFLTTIEPSSSFDSKKKPSSVNKRMSNGKLLIISGGDGYEDFRSTGVAEVAGREDSTNHLLLWNV